MNTTLVRDEALAVPSMTNALDIKSVVNFMNAGIISNAAYLPDPNQQNALSSRFLFEFLGCIFQCLVNLE